MTLREQVFWVMHMKTNHHHRVMMEASPWVLVLGIIVLTFLASGECKPSSFSSSPVMGRHKDDFSSSTEVTIDTKCFPGVFVYGDSLVDNGNSIAVYPEKFARIELDPFGATWPKHGADRFSDGRLLGDYISWGVGQYPMAAYLRSIGGLFDKGANLAASGSTVLPRFVRNQAFQEDDVFPHTPFTLQQQLQWLRRFRYRVSELSKGNTNQSAISVSTFNSSLHLVAAGYTDYIIQYMSHVPHSEVMQSVPDVVNGIANFVEKLYTVDGVTNIMVVNLPPLGCTPAFLSLFPAKRSDYDHHGCNAHFNEAINLHNKQLFDGVQGLRAKYPLLSVSYANFNRAFKDILKRPAAHGFKANKSSELLTACCGTGKTYNFSTGVTCGVSGEVDGSFYNGTACANPSQHLFWDGFHPTDAVNRIAVVSFLNGTNIYPARALTPGKCKPDFTFHSN